MWAGPPQWTQWALNPSAYQDMSNDQVDWARLAQQWIMMKETVPPQQPPAPATTPVEKPAVQVEEGGEAPMDIGKDDDEPQTSPENWNYAGWQGPPQWNPATAGYSSPWPPGGPHAVMPTVAKNGSDNLAYNYSTATPNFDFNSAVRPDSFAQAAGFWPDGSLMPPGGQPMPFLRGSGGHRGQRWESNKMRDDLASEEEEEAEPVIDAAKRRTLPIWIREGLEKMEREKQKKLERERAEQERAAAMQARRLEEAAALNEIRQERGLPPRSKFESDSDEKSDEDDAPPAPSPPRISSPEPPKRKSRFHDGPPPVVPIIRKKSPIRLTKEEMVLRVRRTMTEVLLDITTSEILAVVTETLAKARRKAPAVAAANNNHMPITSLTGNLGLGMYGSDEESSSDDSEHEDKREHDEGHSGEESDTNLREEIRRRKAEFVSREREIQDAAAAAEHEDDVGGGEHEVAQQQGVESQVETVQQRASTPDGAKAENGVVKVEKEKRPKSSSSHSSEDSSSTSSKRKHKRKKRKRDRKHRSTSRDRKRRDRSGSREKKHRDRSVSRDRSTSRERRRRDRSDSREKRRRERSESRENKRRRSESRERKSTRHRSESVEKRRRDRSESRENRRRRDRSTSRDNKRRRDRSDSKERKRRSESRDKKSRRSESKDREKRERRRNKSRSVSPERRRRSRSNESRSRHRRRRSHSSESDYSRRRRNRKHRSSSSSASDKRHRKRR